MKYRAVGFDWGGVLNGRPSKFFSESVAELLGVTVQKYKEAYFRHNKKINRGDVTWEQLWQLVLADLGQPTKQEEVLKLSYEANADALNEDVLEIVDALRGAGYKVGLLSNNTHEKAAAMRDMGLDKHFDVFQISAETGLVKPEPEAFLHLAEELGVQPEELVFVDDTEKSLSTSEECGFTPILFESGMQLANELRRLGINF